MKQLCKVYTVYFEATIKRSLRSWAIHTTYLVLAYLPGNRLFGCQFLVKLFSLNRRFKIKAPDLAIPFCGAVCMHCLEIQGQFLSYRFSLFLFCYGNLYCCFPSILL